MEFDRKKAGARIRLHRKDKGLNITELATEIGIKRPTLSNIERGEKGPSLEVTIKLSLFFDVSIEYLLCLTDDPKHFRQVQTD